MHGGAAAQVRRRAQERIAFASDPAAAKLVALMQDPVVPYAIQFNAARDLLDRNNMTGKQAIEVELKPWEKLLQGAEGIAGIVATIEAGAPMRPFVEGQPDPDPLVIEAQRVDVEEEYSPDDADWSDDFAYGSEPPTPRPVQEPAMRDGADRPPPKHPMPGPRRIEPGDDDWTVPRTYTPSPRPPRKGRVAGRRR